MWCWFHGLQFTTSNLSIPDSLHSSILKRIGFSIFLTVITPPSQLNVWTQCYWATANKKHECKIKQHILVRLRLHCLTCLLFLASLVYEFGIMIVRPTILEFFTARGSYHIKGLIITGNVCLAEYFISSLDTYSLSYKIVPSLVTIGLYTTFLFISKRWKSCQRDDAMLCITCSPKSGLREQLRAG